MLLQLEQAPWNALYRGVVGFAFIPAFRRACDNHSVLSVALFFVGTLLSLRLVPMVVRHVVPFSQKARTIWLRKRQLAKRCDSYQWRKLLWFGIGLALYSLVDGVPARSFFYLTSFCLLTGGIAHLVSIRTQSTWS
jgi:hypothetical protein